MLQLERGAIWGVAAGFGEIHVADGGWEAAEGLELWIDVSGGEGALGKTFWREAGMRKDVKQMVIRS
jgi:hypothetical protein